ncbi:MULTISPECIES: hypothetical protein [unclassified Paraflavitalea]|uniref:hypothetical protein n=1 Tax=unclassified Paraflavitalea TaxID=2798305 RepID=UPI003D33E83C
MSFIDQLSTEEKAFFNELKGVDKDTVWLPAISNVVMNPTVDRFRLLVSELKEQTDEHEGVMISILGQTAVEKLKLL